MGNIIDLDFITEEQQNTISDVIYREIKDPYGFIYITTNLINGMRYLGQRKFSDGWQNYLGSGNWFKKALEKYGRENFKKDIILICYSDEELNQAEYDLSILFDVVVSEDWYNLVLGGGTSRGWRPSEETKRKQSEKAKERFADPTNHPMYGKPGLSGERNSQFGISPKERMDEETYAQWYEKHKLYWDNPATKGKHIWADKQHPNLGKEMPEETRKKISKARLGKYAGENASFYGRQHTDESKAKMSEVRNSPDWWRCRRVYCIELSEIFWSAAAAFDKYKFDSSCIIACCKEKRKSCGKHPITGDKLHWLYAEDAIQQKYITQQDLDDYLNNLKQKGNGNL